MTDFKISLRDAAQHGIIVGVSLPSKPDPVAPEVLDRLHPEERSLAEGFKGYRQISFVGGRLAARSALQALGRRQLPILPDAQGAPIAPRGVSLSITHKRHLAIALVARAELGHLGVDLEETGRDRMGIASKVLTQAELTEVQKLPPDCQWTNTVIRFSIKEAIYKALAPTLKRYIAFTEAEVRPTLNGTAEITLLLDGDLAPHSLEARYAWLEESVLATVRARFR